MLLVKEAQKRRQIAFVLNALEDRLGSLEGGQRLKLHLPHVGMLDVIEASHRIILLDLCGDRMGVFGDVLAQLECVDLLALVGAELLHPLLVGCLVDGEDVRLLRCEEVRPKPSQSHTDNLLVFAAPKDINDVGSLYIVLVPINRLKDHFDCCSLPWSLSVHFFCATR